MSVTCPACGGSDWKERAKRGLRFPDLQCGGCEEVFTLKQIFKIVAKTRGIKAS